MRATRSAPLESLAIVLERREVIGAEDLLVSPRLFTQGRLHVRGVEQDATVLELQQTRAQQRDEGRTGILRAADLPDLFELPQRAPERERR